MDARFPGTGEYRGDVSKKTNNEEQLRLRLYTS